LFYVALILVLAVLGTWNSSAFLEWLDAQGFNIVIRSAIAIGVMGGIPALVIIFGGLLDAIWANRK